MELYLMICQKERTPMPLPLENLGANSVDNPNQQPNALPPVKTGNLVEDRKARQRERHRLWVLANPEKDKASKLKYYEKNKHKMAANVDKEKKKAWEKKRNSDPQYKAHRKERYQKNRPTILAQARASRLRNPTYQNEYKKRRRRESIQVKLSEWLRMVIGRAVRRDGGIKSDHTVKLMGCTVPELIAHLEGLFLPGMFWDNRSLWHVDHKRPLASYDLMKPEDQIEAFHFSNLQPLWATDNWRKGDSWNG
jgi:hypothetical protein